MKRTILALILLPLTACVFAGCPKKPPQEEGGGMMAGGPQPVAVFVEPVVMQDYASAVSLVGDVRAAQRTVLAAEVSGAVTHIAHRVGEAFNGGALIQIDPANYHAGLSGAQAQLTQAEEHLRLVEAGPRAQEIAAQEAQVAAAKAQADQAQDFLQRQRELYEKGVIAETALIAAQTAAESAASAHKAQQEVLDQMHEGSRPEDIASAKAGVKAVQSAVTSAEIALGKTSVAAPFAAVVTALYVEEGQFVGPGTPLAEVVADGTAEAWFNLPEEYIGRIEPGNSVEIRCDAYKDEVFMGKIISISPQADASTRQFPTRVQLSDKRLLPGMAINGRLYLEEPKPAIMVPRDAVTTGALGETVYIMDMASMAPPADGAGAAPGGAAGAGGAAAGGGAAAQPPMPKVKMMIVKTGDTVGRMAVVLEGDLKPGMMIVSRGNESLYEGASIIPTNLMGGEQGGAPGGAEGGAPPAAGEAPQAGAAPSGDTAAGQPGAPAPGEGTPAEPSAPAEGAGK